MTQADILLPVKNDRALWRVGRFRDLPQEMRCAFERIEGALPSVRYANGKFFKVVWVQTHPVSWQEKVEIQMDSNDALALTADWGVEARIGWGMLL